MVSNLNINNILAKFSGQASNGVLSAIQNASQSTGVDFAYMLQQAKAESSFNPSAKAKTSSASGLYQFIESTWMDTVERHGAKHGIDTEGMSRQQILNLRNDAEIASNMAAEFALENKQFLDSAWGGDIGATELYLAHFMGAGGSASFLNARDDNPLMAAADIFPKAAAANRNVFYDSKTGEPRTLEGVYAYFDKKFQIDGDLNNAPAKPSSSVFQNNQTLPDLENNSYESLLFAELSRRGMNVFGNNDNAFPGGFSRESRTMPLYSLVRSPVSLMMIAEADMPYEKTSARESRNKSESDQQGQAKDISI